MTKAEIIELLLMSDEANGHPSSPETLRKGYQRETKAALWDKLDCRTSPKTSR